LPPSVHPPSTASTQQARFFIGTSGWAYPTWKPEFYPEGTPSRLFLQAYAAKLTSVEVNYTFSTLPTAAQLQGWLDAVPAEFRFSFKAPQRITHFQRLRESAYTVSEFLAALEPARKAGKLGSLLFQLPPNFKADRERLAFFLALPAFANPRTQIAFEFRHASWFTEDTYRLLRDHNAALCVAESDDLDTPDIVTADFRFYRLRKDGGYSAAKLKSTAKRFAEATKGRDTYVYFKHEEEPTGALNAASLLKLLHKSPGAQA
jgi:uncharacterized protein YecE (DUF72 family)